MPIIGSVLKKGISKKPLLKPNMAALSTIYCLLG